MCVLQLNVTGILHRIIADDVIMNAKKISNGKQHNSRTKYNTNNVQKPLLLQLLLAT